VHLNILQIINTQTLLKNSFSSVLNERLGPEGSNGSEYAADTPLVCDTVWSGR
jgi:hypothetical protein